MEILKLPKPSNWQNYQPIVSAVPQLPAHGVKVTMTAASAGQFPNGPLAINALNEFRSSNAETLRALSCRNHSCRNYMTRLQVINSFVGDVARAARATQGAHVIVIEGISTKKAGILERLVEPFNVHATQTNPSRGPVWILLTGNEAVPSLGQCSSAVRRGVVETRYILG